MGQFSIIPEREKILARIPNYSVTSEPITGTVNVLYQGTVIARSHEALTVKETKHADVIYLPRQALVDEYFTPTSHSTYCPFKGHANYWSLMIDGKLQDNIVWSYETPYEEVAQLKNYVSFYTDRTLIEQI